MTRWIKLHKRADGASVILNANNIRYIEKSTGKVEKDGYYYEPCTTIVYDIDDAVRVRESMEEVARLLCQSEN